MAGPRPGTRATTPAIPAPTARQASQKPAVNISDTNRAIATRNQSSQSSIWFKAATLGRIALSNSSPRLRSLSMTLRKLPFLTATLLIPIVAAAQTTRQTLKGDSVAIYNLVGELRVDPGSGSDVVVEISRGGADASRLEVQSGPIRGRETLRIIYPDDVIRLPNWGRGWNTTMRVRDDGTFGDGGDWGRGSRDRGRREGREVRISGRGRDGLEAFADLRVTVPAGKSVALYLGVGKAFVTNVDGQI